MIFKKSVNGMVMMLIATSLHAQTNQSLNETLEWGRLQTSESSFTYWGVTKEDRFNVDYLILPQAELQAYGKEIGVSSTLLRDAAMKLGANVGMAAQTARIRQQLDSAAHLLDRLDFKPLLLANGKITPAVLSTANQHVSVSDNEQVLRLAGKSFHIVRQARFVTVPPTWRDYLYQPYAPPERPSNAELPKTEHEFLYWQHWVVKGWQQGKIHADRLYKINIAKLRRDLVGMYLFHILQKRGMVSLPSVERELKAVSGDDNNLIINDRVLTIKVLPILNHKTENWRAIELLPELFGKGIQ